MPKITQKKKKMPGFHSIPAPTTSSSGSNQAAAVVGPSKSQELINKIMDECREQRRGQNHNSSLILVENKRPKKANLSTSDGWKFLVRYFRYRSTIEQEIEFEVQRFEISEEINEQFLQTYAARWLRLFLEDRQYRILYPLRFLSFVRVEHEVHLNVMYTKPEAQSASGYDKRKKTLEELGIVESGLHLYDRNLPFDWMWFELRKNETRFESPSETVKFVDNLQSFIIEKYNKVEDEIEAIAVANKGKIITKAQLSYEICRQLTNFTDIAKDFIEKRGDDEYDEEECIIPIFERWWSEECAQLRSEWTFRPGWRLITEAELQEHVSFKWPTFIFLVSSNRF